MKTQDIKKIGALTAPEIKDAFAEVQLDATQLALVEIAAQLANLNEKFLDYFESLEPTEIDTKRGVR